jgi:hypothetical protein
MIGNGEASIIAFRIAADLYPMFLSNSVAIAASNMFSPSYAMKPLI